MKSSLILILNSFIIFHCFSQSNKSFQLEKLLGSINNEKRELEEKRKALASLISSDYPVDGEMVDELIEDEQEDNNRW